ncbi:MAG: hypothetical protein AAF791_05035 [Bacteroidota bacterium]
MRLFVALALLLLAGPARGQFPLPVLGPDDTDWEILQIEAAPNGAFYVLGSFEGELILTPGMSPDLVWDAPNPTGFLARISDAGLVEWAFPLEARRQNFGDESSATPKRIAVLPNGDVVLLGTLGFILEIDLDPGPGQEVLTAGRDISAFVVRYTADGAYVWSAAMNLTGSVANTNAMGLGVDGGRVFALIPAAFDADPGPAEVVTTVPALVAMDAATGASVFVEETSLPLAGTFSPSVAHDLAAGGGSVYIVGHSLPFNGANRFTLSRHDAATGVETWTFTTTEGRDLLTSLDIGANGTLIAAGPLSSSATGIALDPSDPGTLTLSRDDTFRTALARYTPGGVLEWAEAIPVNIGAWGGGIAVEGGEVFGSGFGHLRVFSEADGSLLRSLPDAVGNPNLRDVGASTRHVVSYVDPEDNDSFEIQGVPDGLPPTLLVQFERSDLSLILSPPVASEPAAESRVGAIDVPHPHPHPLRSQGTVSVSLPEAADVRLALVDALGREVAVLREAPMAAGAHTVRLDAQDLAPGVYLLVLDADGHRATRPVVVAR